MYRLRRTLFEQTFEHFRACGKGRRECQTLWLSEWSTPESISRLVHPVHRSHAGGFDLDDKWLHLFWMQLTARNEGVRIQVHTHPGEAFHSETDDRYPIIHTYGFLSLVVPDYGLGPVSFDRAFLCEIAQGGRWAEVPVASRIRLVQ